MVLVVERLQECGGCGENSQLGRIRSSAVDYVSSQRGYVSCPAMAETNYS